ncbi:NADH-ubiquinone oxidoreductase subunit E family protein [Halarcobacter sp.]|uniref:NADH-ubiquinone oxidoreductase subunit E family protein n=1 Tax=Halarcobacter sp. TaxID=2321133 RepID=UPI003A957D68
MKRFDLRPLKENFYDRMLELMDKDISKGENAIFLFEIGDFSCVQKSADVIKDAGYTLMNSIKFNEVDWTIVVKKEKPLVEEKIEENKEEDKED